MWYQLLTSWTVPCRAGGASCIGNNVATRECEGVLDFEDEEVIKKREECMAEVEGGEDEEPDVLLWWGHVLRSTQSGIVTHVKHMARASKSTFGIRGIL